MSTLAMPETTIKILLVDDEVNITKALRRLLMEYAQYQVFVANSGLDALDELKAEPDIGVIISDQRMPGMSGVEFLQEARKLTPDAVRILLTGYADIEASIAAINQGAVFRYLTKPWQDDELIQVVADAAKNYWLVSENKRLNALVAQQNEELQEWNSRLKTRVLDQTSQIRSKSDALAETNQQLQVSFGSTIESLTGLIEMRDRRSPGHSRNVAELVTVMAEKLTLPAAEQTALRSAGLLHDIGKIGMPDHLLGKSAADLDGTDLLEYQNHVVRGQAAIDLVPSLRDIGLMIRHHHENFDGSGFPDRLKGEAIPVGARLITAADMFERKLMQFPEAEALRAALKELENEWGKSLDPGLRLVLEAGAQEVYSHLDISSEVMEIKVSPKELEAGMLLNQDLYSGTKILLLKKGAVFNEENIEAIKRCQTIDPFERDIRVLIERGDGAQ